MYLLLICEHAKPDLAVFGASMAGSCAGFLLHNRYKASVYMGDTGSLALGGALAAMAACTGMFFPLLISSGIFVVEASSVMIQVLSHDFNRILCLFCHRLIVTFWLNRSFHLKRISFIVYKLMLAPFTFQVHLTVNPVLWTASIRWRHNKYYIIAIPLNSKPLVL